VALGDLDLFYLRHFRPLEQVQAVVKMTFFHIRKYFARPTSEIKTAQVNALAVKEGKTGLKK
jgi:hypothetical protein